MDQQIKSIDVEAIMEEIRQRIKERGETEEVLGFDETTVDKECMGGVLGSVRYNENELHHYLSCANEEHNIAYYQMILKGGLKSFIKRSIRKLISFIIIPLRDGQNRYNAYTVQTMMQLEAYTLEQNERLKKQEEDIEKLSQRLQTLEKAYEDLKASVK